MRSEHAIGEHVQKTVQQAMRWQKEEFRSASATPARRPPGRQHKRKAPTAVSGRKDAKKQTYADQLSFSYEFHDKHRIKALTSHRQAKAGEDCNVKTKLALISCLSIVPQYTPVALPSRPAWRLFLPAVVLGWGFCVDA